GGRAVRTWLGSAHAASIRRGRTAPTRGSGNQHEAPLSGRLANPRHGEPAWSRAVRAEEVRRGRTSASGSMSCTVNAFAPANLAALPRSRVTHDRALRRLGQAAAGAAMARDAGAV